MIKRALSAKLKTYLQKYPVVTLTGVRQCGKSTLLRNELEGYEYLSLEDPDIRDFAKGDPRGFLDNCKVPTIIDEAQRVPELFSYIQTRVDREEKAGEFVLSGSHNFLLMQSVSQSLAGRTAVLTLAPLSIGELSSEGILPKDTDELMLKGFYPAIYSRKLEPEEFFPSYIQTYIEKDVRLLRNIPNASDFTRLVRLLAARSGQIVNQAELSAACGVSVPTIRAWLSILKQSYVIFELEPYYKNYTKRVVRSPKMYFYDTGLLCYFLGIETAEELRKHPQRGAIFETMVVTEYFKSRFFSAKEPRGYFFRDSNQNEVDLLTEDKGKLRAYEIKAGKTMESKYLSNLKKFAGSAGLEGSDIACIYAGDKTLRGENGSFIRYTEAF